MKCPSCNGKTHVLDTRGVNRRRECTNCGERFWTAEILRDDLPEYLRPTINWDRTPPPVLTKLPWH